MTRGRTIAVGMALLAIGLSGIVMRAAREPDLRSRWRNGDISVDGKADEWAELTRIAKSELRAAFVNDGEALYVCVITSDAATRQQVLRDEL